MKTALQMFAILPLSLLIIAVSLVTFTLHAVQSTVLKPYSWNAHIKESGAYPLLSEYVAATITPANESDPHEEPFREAMARAVKEAATAEWLEEKWNLLQTTLWDYMLGRTDRLADIPIPELEAALIQELRRELDRMASPPVNADTQIARLQEQIPDAVNLYETYNVNEEGLRQLREGYQLANAIMRLLWLLLAVLVLSGALILFYPKGIARWLGYVALGSGLLTGLLYGCVRWLDPRMRLERLWADSLKDLHEPASRFLLHLLDRMLAATITLSIMALLFGTAALIASHTPLMEKWNTAARTRLAGSKMHRVVRATGIIVTFGIFVAVVCFNVKAHLP